MPKSMKMNKKDKTGLLIYKNERIEHDETK